MSEILRTYVAGLLSPTTFLGFFWVFCLWHLHKKNNKKSRILISSAVFCFFLFTLAPLRMALYLMSEAPLTRPGNDYEYVVVLGSRIFPKEDVPLSSQLGNAIMSRLIYGISLLNKNPSSKLILTGNGGGDIPEAELLKAQAIELGVSPDRIITDNLSTNTKDHGKYLRPILQNKRFLVVTSANHMARALRNFESYGLNGVAAPTDFTNKGPLGADSFIPRGENLAALDRWFAELYSKIWTELRLIFT